VGLPGVPGAPGLRDSPQEAEKTASAKIPNKNHAEKIRIFMTHPTANGLNTAPWM
jgi:hypothetical protein